MKWGAPAFSIVDPVNHIVSNLPDILALFALGVKFFQEAFHVLLMVGSIAEDRLVLVVLTLIDIVLVASLIGIDRVLFGSDWPYISLDANPPDPGRLVDLFDRWTPDAGLRQKLFVDNPRSLYLR